MKKIYILLLLGALIGASAYGQTPTDGFAMKKGEICIASVFQLDRWEEYWEGELKRDNPNLGAVSTRSWQNMFALGIGRQFNFMAMLPYVSTKASDGVLAGHSGLQDLGLWLKWRPYEKTIGTNRLETFLSAGFSTPLSNYYPDFLPLSIGLGSTVGNLKGVVHFWTAPGFYATGQAGYQLRSNIELERNSYYTDRGYNTSEVDMPDVLDYSFLLGYLNPVWRIEAAYQAMNTLGGTDIRRNDMPFPSNNMDFGRLNLMVQVRPAGLKGLGFTANGSYVLHGRNVGQSLGLGAGLLWQFFAWKPKEQ